MNPAQARLTGAMFSILGLVAGMLVIVADGPAWWRMLGVPITLGGLAGAWLTAYDLDDGHVTHPLGESLFLVPAFAAGLSMLTGALTSTLHPVVEAVLALGSATLLAATAAAFTLAWRQTDPEDGDSRTPGLDEPWR